MFPSSNESSKKVFVEQSWSAKHGHIWKKWKRVIYRSEIEYISAKNLLRRTKKDTVTGHSCTSEIEAQLALHKYLAKVTILMGLA